MSDFEAKRFDFPFKEKKWKRYTKEDKERDRRRSENSAEKMESFKFDDLFPTSDSLRRIRGLSPERLTPAERRQLISAFLAAACLRLEAEKKSNKGSD